MQYTFARCVRKQSKDTYYQPHNPIHLAITNAQSLDNDGQYIGH